MSQRVVQKDGTVFVSVDESRQWPESLELRESTRHLADHRLYAVCTPGGYMVDVWQVDHWQSGLEHDDGAVGWSADMGVPNS